MIPPPRLIFSVATTGIVSVATPFFRTSDDAPFAPLFAPTPDSFCVVTCLLPDTPNDRTPAVAAACSPVDANVPAFDTVSFPLVIVSTRPRIDENAKSSIDGKAVYEAPVKAKDGTTHDLVITEDGKLVQTKADDAADAALERADRGKKLLAGVKFSHPRRITHPYLPLSWLKKDVLEGTEDKKKTRVERTPKPEVVRTFKVGGQRVEAFAVEDRAFENGKLAEVALDFFARDDAGTVYHLGEEVDEYADGKIISHDGSWMVGKDTTVPGVLLPADPKGGTRFRSEDVSAEISEIDEVVSTSETVKTPAGEFKDCVKVKEDLGDGTTEYKYYAKGVGCVREVPHDGDEAMTSHEAIPAK
jgi:hypothetical protein